MLLHVYVNHFQIGDFGHPPLSVGLDISVTIVGYPGSTLAVEVPILDCYLAKGGKKALVRTGLAEYAFSGEILELRKEERRGGTVYQEALVDCGVPIIFAARGFPAITATELDSLSALELSKGRYLSGLIWLNGLISYREPALIEQRLKARVVSIAVIDLMPKAEVLAGVREEQSVDSYGARLPAILGIEV